MELRVPLIIREYHHVALVEAAALDQVLHVLHVVDAPAQLAALTKVVDPDEKSFLCSLAVAEKAAAVVWGSRRCLLRWGRIVSLRRRIASLGRRVVSWGWRIVSWIAMVSSIGGVARITRGWWRGVFCRGKSFIWNSLIWMIIDMF